MVGEWIGWFVPYVVGVFENVNVFLRLLKMFVFAHGARVDVYLIFFLSCISQRIQ